MSESKNVVKMTSLSVARVPERCLWAALIFGTLYESYRYPLQFNQVGMSPEYSDTPPVFQIAKFFIILMTCLVALRYLSRRTLPFSKWALAVFVVCMSAFPVAKAIGADVKSVEVYLDIAFWPLAALILAISAKGISITALDRYFRFVFVYALASTAFEVFLFLAIGRLPSIGTPDSINVRFGGFLDDPNGFAALLYMLMGWSYYHFSGRRRWFAEAALVLCVLLTQSLTAIGFLIMLALLFMVRQFVRRPKPLLLACLGIAAVALLNFFRSQLGDLVSALIDARSESVSIHVSQVTDAPLRTALDWILGGSYYVFDESWWFGSLINFGAVWYLLNILVTATLVRSTYIAFRRDTDRRRKAITAGILMFSFYFVAANVNLPLFKVFPVNFLFFLFSYSIFFERLREDGPPALEVAAISKATRADMVNVRLQ